MKTWAELTDSERLTRVGRAAGFYVVWLTVLSIAQMVVVSYLITKP